MVVVNQFKTGFPDLQESEIRRGRLTLTISPATNSFPLKS